jgi:hypothetical protein
MMVGDHIDASASLSTDRPSPFGVIRPAFVMLVESGWQAITDMLVIRVAYRGWMWR